MSLTQALSSPDVVDGLTFRHEEASDITASSARFRNCHFSECNFRQTVFRDCEFIACRFSHCDFREAEFYATAFVDGESRKGGDWAYCDLTEASFNACNMSMSTISKSDASLLSVTDCSASGLQFDATVHRKVGRKSILGGVFFRRTKLQYASFQPGDYEGSVLEGCDLRDCSFAESNLAGASFAGSSLDNADFSGATLDRAVFARATFAALDLSVARSFHGLSVSRDQHEAILRSMGIVTAD